MDLLQDWTRYLERRASFEPQRPRLDRDELAQHIESAGVEPSRAAFMADAIHRQHAELVSACRARRCPRCDGPLAFYTDQRGATLGGQWVLVRCARNVPGRPVACEWSGADCWELS